MFCFMSGCFLNRNNKMNDNPHVYLSLITVSDLDTSSDFIVSGCFDRLLRVWSFPDCRLIRTIEARHAVNCVSVCDDLVATCSRTGCAASPSAPNVIIWRISTGDIIRTLDLPSCCFVKVSINVAWTSVFKYELRQTNQIVTWDWCFYKMNTSRVPFLLSNVA